MTNREILEVVVLLIPLFTIAGSSVAFVWKQYLDRSEARNREMFELMKLLDEPGTLASKLGAIYRLREFRKHKSFVVRFCERLDQNVAGQAADAIRLELQETRDYMDSI